MLQHVPTTSAPIIGTDCASPCHDENAVHTAMISFADPGPHSRVVVHGANTLELQCALLRRGCGSVFAIREGGWPLTDTIDVVLLPDVDRPDQLDRAVAQAHRILAPLGTLALQLASAGALVRHTTQLLTLHGFAAIRWRAVAGGALCRAELPWFSPLARA